MKDEKQGKNTITMHDNPKKLKDIPLSVLDLVMVNAGSSPSQSMRNSLDLAQHAERWGYKRYWLAEHHNIKSVASTCYLCFDRFYSWRYFYHQGRLRWSDVT